MANNIFTKLTIATVSAALSFTTIEAKPIQAATITYDFDVYLTSGPQTGNTYAGSFNYNNSTLTGTGLETVGVSQGLSVSFDYLGVTYTEADDLKLSPFSDDPRRRVDPGPLVSLSDGDLLGLDFIFSKDGVPTRISDSRFNEQSASTRFVNSGIVTYALRDSEPVPEPGSALGLGVLGIGLLLMKKIGFS